VAEFSSASENQFREMHEVARQIFLHALAQATVDNAFQLHVSCDRGVLRICEDLYDLHSYARVFVVFHREGRAQHGAGPRSAGGSSLEGIVASSSEPGPQIRGCAIFVVGIRRRMPNLFRAAEAILKSLMSQNASSLVIFLLSGGGSSMVEKTIDGEISLEDVIVTYRALVHSGAPIVEINAIRKHLSAVKGGRLAQAAYPAQQVSLLISDVPDSQLDALASGPPCRIQPPWKICYAIAAKYALLEQLPGPVVNSFVVTRWRRRRSRMIGLLSVAMVADIVEQDGCGGGRCHGCEVGFCG